jgi:hypothetical protein
MRIWTGPFAKSVLLGLAVWCGAAGALVGTARADFITFRADGTAATQLNNIGTFNYSAGNAVAASALPLTVGDTFQLYFQARLSSVQNDLNQTLVPTGLNTAYEVTVVGSLTEVVTSVSGGPPASATFALAAAQTPNSFIEIWQHAGLTSNPLAGTGFNTGTRILLATPNAAIPNSGNFSFASPQPGTLPPFDSFGVNNYPGVTSVVGSGSANITGSVNTLNAAFFPNATFNTVNFSPIGNATPFTLVDPSHLFAALANGVAPAFVPNIGTVNGAPPGGGGGPDFQFQAITQNGFGTIPEPASISLLSMGGVGLLIFGWRKRNQG